MIGDNRVMAISSSETGGERRALHYIAGEWVEGNPPIMGPMTNAAWMASVAFDGARAFSGLAPDLERHAARCINSARVLGLDPKLGADDIVALEKRSDDLADLMETV